MRMIRLEDIKRLPEDFMVFYCWQDHLDSSLHRFLIRDALDEAIERVQKAIPPEAKCTLRWDSDTSGKAGAVEIADSILGKIQQASALVADVTPVLQDVDKQRHYPNPNVMLELGYGAHVLGWNRVLCLYNDASEVAKEAMPFDIRHRRLNSFRCADRTERTKAKDQLVGLLDVAIRTIVQEVARGVVDPSAGTEAVKRRRDTRLIQDVMATINTDVLDSYTQNGREDRLVYDAIYFWYHFSSIVEASGFRFYDQELERRVRELHRHWGMTHYLGGHLYGPHELIPGRLSLLPERKQSTDYKIQLVEHRKELFKMDESLRALVIYVHDNFPEVDRSATNAAAIEAVKPYLETNDDRS